MRRGREGAETAADMTITASIAATAGTVAGTTAAIATAAHVVIAGTALPIPDATTAANSHLSAAVGSATVTTDASPTTKAATTTAARAALSSLRDVPGCGRTITTPVAASILISSNRGPQPFSVGRPRIPQWPSPRRSSPR